VAGGTTVFDETVTGGPGSAAVIDALARARAALQAQLGQNAVITGPEQTQSTRTQVTQNPTNQVNHIETSVTSSTTFGPATILVGPDQSITCFIAAGSTNVNVNTHTETFVDSILPAQTFLNTTQLQLTGTAGGSLKPVVPQIFQLPFKQALFSGGNRNKVQQPLQVFITPQLVNTAP
jgi:hypothetical protein